jgi:hypothetical protein
MGRVIVLHSMLGGHGNLLLLEWFEIRDGHTLGRARSPELNERAKLVDANVAVHRCPNSVAVEF